MQSPGDSNDEGQAHVAWEELVERLKEARGHLRGSTEQLTMLKELVDACPCFTPALITLGSNLKLNDDPGETVAGLSLADAGELLRRAVDVSGRSARALTERAWHLHRLEAEPELAEPLFAEAVDRARAELEEASVGLATSLLEQERYEEADACLAEALLTLPASKPLAELRKKAAAARSGP